MLNVLLQMTYRQFSAVLEAKNKMTSVGIRHSRVRMFLLYDDLLEARPWWVLPDGSPIQLGE